MKWGSPDLQRSSMALPANMNTCTGGALSDAVVSLCAARVGLLSVSSIIDTELRQKTKSLSHRVTVAETS